MWFLDKRNRRLSYSVFVIASEAKQPILDLSIREAPSRKFRIQSWIASLGKLAAALLLAMTAPARFHPTPLVRSDSAFYN